MAVPEKNPKSKQLVETVKQAIKTFSMFKPGDKVLAGVSGGPDSIALLYLLDALSHNYSITLGICHFNHSLRGESADNDAEFVAGLAKRLARVNSIHHVHTPEIALQDADRARGIWPMMDYLEFPPEEAPQEAPGSRGFVGWGYYEEEYRRTPEGWRFAFMRLTRQRIDALPPDHPFARPGRFSPTRDWL